MLDKRDRGAAGRRPDRRRAARPAAPFPMAEIDALGRHGSSFTWVRPLRRITCLLDGAVVPLRSARRRRRRPRPGCRQPDRGPPLPRPRRVSGHLRRRLAGQAARPLRDGRRRGAQTRDRRRPCPGLPRHRALSWIDDPGLLDEVAGLVEWPVPLLGRIDDAFMDLPPEVMQVSMRVNQRYFALRRPEGGAAPWFAFVANIEADGRRRGDRSPATSACCAPASPMRAISGTWIAASPLESRVAALDGVTFHAKLGTQGERVARLRRLAPHIAPLVGAEYRRGRSRRACWPRPT